jgi:hypothetical protein
MQQEIRTGIVIILSFPQHDIRETPLSVDKRYTFHLRDIAPTILNAKGESAFKGV